MEYTSYFLERIDTTFNQILCQSFYIPHFDPYISHFILHLSHIIYCIYPIFIPYLASPDLNPHVV